MPVYFVAEIEHGGTPIKIGVAQTIENRIRSLQTGNPSKLGLLGWIETNNPYSLEKSLHSYFKNFRLRGEWFHLEPTDILPVLMRAGLDGFVAKTSDSFQIIGFDRDAVPEYVGIWEWGDLEFHECCPFCGCMCGMHFQDASQMFHCINCDTLTDFSELSSRDQEANN